VDETTLRKAEIVTMPHHYVPQCILRGFVRTDAAEQIWVWDLKAAQQFSPNIKKAFAINDDNDVQQIERLFKEQYDANLDVEGELAIRIEGPGAVIMEHLRKLRTLEGISAEDRGSLARLMAAQYLRTPSYRARARNLAVGKGYGMNAGELKEFSKLEPNPSDLDPVLGELMVASIVNEIHGVADALGQSDIQLCTAPVGIEFIIGDDPFLVHNDRKYEVPKNLSVAHWFGVPEAEVWMPISSEVCIRLHRDPSKPRCARGEIRGDEELSPEQIRWVNEHQIAAASRFVACQSGRFNDHGLKR
jgi:hypothetical protein